MLRKCCRDEGRKTELRRSAALGGDGRAEQAVRAAARPLVATERRHPRRDRRLRLPSIFGVRINNTTSL